MGLEGKGDNLDDDVRTNYVDFLAEETAALPQRWETLDILTDGYAVEFAKILAGRESVRFRF